MKKQKIAVVGGGICGWAVTWYLLKKGCKVDLYDPADLGENASGIAAGLLHTYTGAHAKLPHRGREGFQATMNLLKVSSETLGSQVYKKTPILRLATTDEQKADFFQCSQLYQDVKWLTNQEVNQLHQSLSSNPGLWMENGAIINTKEYLKGLSLASQKLGASWIKKEVLDLSMLGAYDQIIVAAGYGSCKLIDLPLRPVKGQVLELSWPKSLPELNFPINSKGYIVPLQDQKILLGATFERNQTDTLPNQDVAMSKLLEKFQSIFPKFGELNIIECRAGIRAAMPNHQPIAEKSGENIWVLSGMGSKGLLYHSLYAKELVDSIIKRPKQVS